MLTGEYRHSLDAKNRVSIPAKLREELGESFVIARSLRGKCIRFYSLQSWADYIEPLKKLDRKLSEQALWVLHHDAATVTPDSLGRVLIPNSLLGAAEVEAKAESGERTLVIAGCGDFGEIWSEKNYDQRLAEMDMDAIRRALEESGL